MQLQIKDLLKDGLEVLTPAEFAKKYGKEVQKEAIYYAIKKDLVDHTTIGDRNYVVTTEHTLQYTPNTSPKRVTKKKATRTKQKK